MKKYRNIFFIRWMGAFRHSKSLSSSLIYELRTKNQRAAEVIDRHNIQSSIHWAKVGLLFNSADKVFECDVWSISKKNGQLKYKYRNKHSLHAEAWVTGRPVAIVVKGNISRNAWRTVFRIAKEENLPILKLRNGRLNKIK